MKRFFETRLLASATLVFLVGVFLSGYTQLYKNPEQLKADISNPIHNENKEAYVHFKDKGAIGNQVIIDLKSKVIKPIIAYKATLNKEVAYVLVEQKNSDTFLLNVISSEQGDKEPTYEQITIEKQEGDITHWKPEAN